MTATGRSDPPAPWWYFVAVGALGPALIVQTTGSGMNRLIGLVVVALIVVGLLANDRGRRTLRASRSVRSGARTWRFTGLIVAVIVVTQLVQRAADADDPTLLAAGSFVFLAVTSWWFTRRVEADEERRPDPR